MQYLASVIAETADLATSDEEAASTRSTSGSRQRATGCSPVASRSPHRPPSSTTGTKN